MLYLLSAFCLSCPNAIYICDAYILFQMLCSMDGVMIISRRKAGLASCALVCANLASCVYVVEKK